MLKASETGEKPLASLAEPAELLAARTGLYIPPERSGHLAYCLRAAMRDGGYTDQGSYLSALRDNPPTHPAWQYLLRHLAIGETYFFRDAEVLQSQILPRLIERRRTDGSQTLRIWSIGCATGEEPYTIAILLRELLPDIAAWKINILGTDLNLHALNFARRGLYNAWSMRGSPDAHPDLLRRGSRWQLSEDVRRLVEFRWLNLIDDQIAMHNAHLIVCRNVLLYMERSRHAAILERIKGALAQDGELLLDNTSLPSARKVVDVAAAPRRPPLTAKHITPGPAWDDPFHRAKEAANRAQWVEAHRWLDEAEAQNRLDLPIHYLRALIYNSQGRTVDAIHTLRRCLYLDHNFALGYFTLGNLHAQCGERERARQHWTNAASLLETQPPDQVLSLADGMTVADLLTLIRAQLSEAQR